MLEMALANRNKCIYTYITGWKDVKEDVFNADGDFSGSEEIGSCTITADAMWRQMEVLMLEMAVANRNKWIYTYITGWKDVKEDVFNADGDFSRSSCTPSPFPPSQSHPFPYRDRTPLIPFPVPPFPVLPLPYAQRTDVCVYFRLERCKRRGLERGWRFVRRRRVNEMMSNWIYMAVMKEYGDYSVRNGWG